MLEPLRDFDIAIVDKLPLQLRCDQCYELFFRTERTIGIKRRYCCSASACACLVRIVERSFSHINNRQRVTRTRSLSQTLMCYHEPLLSRNSVLFADYS